MKFSIERIIFMHFINNICGILKPSDPCSAQENRNMFFNSDALIDFPDSREKPLISIEFSLCQNG